MKKHPRRPMWCPKWLFFYGSLTDQIWTLRIHRYVLQLKGPKYIPLFTERYRYLDLIIPLGRGWRINFDRKSS